MVEKTIAHYEVLDEIGAGGMGVVYEAWDTRLERKAAIKALPAELAEDPERLTRLRREAKLLAAMKNPHIATVYGLEEVAGRRFLVMELVEGETLAGRISRGAIPLREALPLALQIAEALEAAHRAGVIHRDIKPGNIMIDENGRAKVLDFGLAKTLRTGVDESDSLSPTLSRSMTRSGKVLGTPVYMSPEQLEGKEADRQSDVWSFACVVYEMLTAKKAFPAPVVSESAVEPDWEALPGSVPAGLHRLLRRCLARDRRKRLRDIGDARLELEDAELAIEDQGTLGAERSRSASSSLGLSLIALILLAAATGWISYSLGRRAAGPAPILSASVDLPDKQFLRPGWAPSVDISADGSRLVYATSDPLGGRIYLRDLATFEETPLPGTEGGSRPFLSPDGQFVGFFANGQLMRVAVAGGVPLPICSGNFGFGGTWGPQGIIVFSADRSLYRVDAAGGTPELIIEPDADLGETGYFRPSFLPDGRAVVFAVDRGVGTDPDQVAAVTLDGKRKVLIADRAGGQPRYVPGERLLYGRSTGLLAVGFDSASLTVTTEEISVLTGVNEYHVALSSTGTLVYQVASQTRPAHLLTVGRGGQTLRLTSEPQLFSEPRLSPTGDRILTVARGADGSDLWTLERARSTLTRLTHDGGTSGVWSPNGEEIVYSTDDLRLMRMRADGSGQPQRIAAGDGTRSVGSITPDGSAVTVVKISDGPSLDLWLQPLDGSEPTPLVRTQGVDGAGMVSPDGEWLAYVSDSSGRPEVYVQRLSGSSGRRQVSVQGGLEPRWSRDGRELFYRSGSQMIRVPLDAGFQPGSPQILFEGQQTWSQGLTSNYDVGVDGTEFIMVEGVSVGTDSLRVVQNWTAELDRRLPAGR